MAEITHHQKKWEKNIINYNTEYNKEYNYDYIISNFLRVVKCDDTFRNPHDNGTHELHHKQCNLCMCDTKIINRFLIYDPNDVDYKILVGSECIEKIDNDNNRVEYFKQVCVKCENLYSFKAHSVNGDLCKVCYKENKDLIKQQEIERIKNEKIQAEQILQAERKERLRLKEIKDQELLIKLKNEIHKCKCGKGTFKIPFKCCYNCNKIDSLMCKCGKTYKKPFKCCYNCNILNKRNNTDNIDNTDNTDNNELDF
tara:strand:- start:393 stop:1157 length:765 start_codon:yes stop_codon:yes gene_type:complete